MVTKSRIRDHGAPVEFLETEAPIQPVRAFVPLETDIAATDLLDGLASDCLFLADRAHDSDAIREFVRMRGAWANIRPKRNRKNLICFCPCLYRNRNQVERFFNRIKHCCRIATRYEKLGANYLASLKIGFMFTFTPRQEMTRVSGLRVEYCELQ